MKTILVDAVNCFVIETEAGNFEILAPMHTMLDTFPNRKIILTGANDEQFKKFGLDKMPYEVFSLKHDPEKSDPQYFQKMLEHFKLSAEEVIYFEHSVEAVASATSVGIKTYHYDHKQANLEELSTFITENI